MQFTVTLDFVILSAPAFGQTITTGDNYVLIADNEVPSIKLELLTLNATLQELINKYVPLDIRWVKPKLVDVFIGDDGLHLIYGARIPRMGLKGEAKWVSFADTRKPNMRHLVDKAILNGNI